MKIFFIIPTIDGRQKKQVRFQRVLKECRIELVNSIDIFITNHM